MSVIEPEFDVHGILLEHILDAIQALQAAVGVQAPVVTVAPPDLGDIVTAVTSLRPGATADEIGAAVARAIQLPAVPDTSPQLEKMAAVLEQVEHRLRAPTAVTGGGVLNLPDSLKQGNAMRVAGDVLDDIKHGVSDFEVQLDYASRSDTQPVYIGRAANATPTSAGTWVIEKLTYDIGNRPTRKQTLTGIWDNRTSLAW